MNCASCGRANRAGARFCGGCGTPLAPRCLACGAENEINAKFCDACGAALAIASTRTPDEGEARKVVTIVFADLVGSTSLHERLDAESTRRLMERYYQTLRSVVDAHGGTVVKLLGDGVVAAFGVPRVAEDDAIRAVRAAVAMVQAVGSLGPDSPLLPQTTRDVTTNNLSIRVGVNTGEVVVSVDNADVVGDPVNVAARLQQATHDGEVVIGESTHRLVNQQVTLEPVGTLSLKGRSETVAAYRVVSLDRPAGAAAVPFVGRDDELRRLMAVYDAATTEPRARLAVILGSPGLGKSRLIDEFAHRLHDRAIIITARCESAGGATFGPLATALRALLQIDDRVGGDTLRATVAAALDGDASEQTRIADGISALLGGTPASPEATFFVVRRFLAALAATQPVLFAFDDLQWAEPLLLDLVEHLVQWSASTPLLILAAARPELRDSRSSLTNAGGVVSDVVTLTGLDAAAATRLAANVIGADALPAAAAGRVLAISEGNPLFLGELVRMLVNDGALKREGDRWTAAIDVANLDMPPTIHALLAARIERLRPEDRLVLERAAVVGRQFSRAAVADLLAPDARAGLDARLESLRRSELVEPDTAWFLGEPALRFHHGLIRDAAYRRILKGTRAELHARFADWVESRVGEVVEHDETIGWHLEQAHQHWRELGSIDERGRSVGERAARYLSAAGRRALLRDDVQVAANLLGRAFHLLDETDSTRGDLALDWCEALLAAGDVTDAKAAVDELGRLTQSPTEKSNPQLLAHSPRLAAWHTCFNGQLAVLTDPQALRAHADAVAAAAEQLAALGDAGGEAKAHSVYALAVARLGAIGACEAALDLALAAARRAHDRRRANAVLAGAPLAALWGPSAVARASGRCLDVVRVLRITQGAPWVEAVALRCQAVLEALRGRADAARRMITASRQMVEELGIAQGLLEADVAAGLIELLEDNAAAAERTLRGAYDGLRSHGLGIDAAQTAALLGRALLAQGRAEEAEALSHESEALAGDDFKAAIAWRGVRAEALAKRGELDAALNLARAAVEIAARTDALLDHGDARMALAAVLRASGRFDEAGAEQKRAIELWGAKGATLLTERVRVSATQPGIEHFDIDSVDTARARSGQPPSPPEPQSGRAARENLATVNARRMDAAAAVRDLAAFLATMAEGAHAVHHPTHTSYHERDLRLGYERLLTTEGLRFAHEPLVTLGERLALCRAHTSFTGVDLNENVRFGAADMGGINLLEVDERGLRTRTEFFADERLDEAIARLYERYAELLPDGDEKARAAMIARAIAVVLPTDLDAIAAVIAPDIEFIDHRVLGLGSARGAERYLRGLRSLVEVTAERSAHLERILAATPQALLLHRRTSGTERNEGGAVEYRFLMLWAFGADGRLTRVEMFDPESEAAALARFDALPGEQPPGEPEATRIPNAATRAVDRFERCWRARDWDGVVATFAPMHVMDDRRALFRMKVAGDDFFANERFLFAMPSSRWRSELIATRGERLALLRVRFTATVDNGGTAAVEMLDLIEVDAAGRRGALVVFAPDDLDAAYAELAARDAASEAARDRRAALTSASTTLVSRSDPLAALTKPNAATAAMDRVQAAFAARDWSAMRAACAADAKIEDRRRHVLVSGDVDWWVADAQRSYALTDNVRYERQLVATAGDRVCVERTLWRGGSSDAAIEIEYLRLIEVDAAGHIVAVVGFDLDDWHAANREAWARWFATDRRAAAALQPMAAFVEAWNVHDLDRMRQMVADDFAMEDHRRLLQRRSNGPEEFLAGLAEMWQLVPDVQIDRALNALAIESYGSVTIGRDVGTFPDGGPFERPRVVVSTVAHGRLTRIEFYEVEDVDAALKRFAELRPDPLHIPPNAATRAVDRWQQAFEAGDVNALRTLWAPTMVFDDRRGTALTVGDRDMLMASTELLIAWHTRAMRTRLATMGERLALERIRWFGTANGVRFEADSLVFTEVDQQGRIIASISFDVGNRRAAAVEMMDRYFHSDEARWTPPSMVEFTRAVAAHDVARMRAALPDDYYFHDHRRTGVGHIGNADDYVASMVAVFEQSADMVTDTLYHVAVDRHGTLTVGRMFGTLADGGDFESVFVRLNLYRDGRIVGVELFEVEDLEVARARFEELRPPPASAQPEELRPGHAPIPENTAGRVDQGIGHAVAAGNWSALRALAAADFTFEDRRKYARVSGDITLYIKNLEVVRSQEVTRRTLELIATIGDRIAIKRLAYCGKADGSEFAGEFLRLTEVDGSGKLLAVIHFEAEDRATATLEAQSRFAANEAAGCRAQAVINQLGAAIARQDWKALPGYLADGLKFRDHRRLRFGEISSAQFIESLHVLSDLGPNVGGEVLRMLAWTDRGSVLVIRQFGATRDGGAFETVFVPVLVVRDDRIVACEVFDAGDAGQALRRFTELCAAFA